MEHGILDAFRNGASKFLDAAFGICRDTFIVIFSFHYRHHQIKRQKHAEIIEARTHALESEIVELRRAAASRGELLGKTSECAKSAAAGATVDLHSNGDDTGIRPRHRKP